MGDWVRAAGVAAVVPLLGELGVDADALLARFDLTAADLLEPDAVLSLETAARVLEAAAARAGRPDLGLTLAERYDVRLLGALSVAVESASTMGEAMLLATRYLAAHSPGMSLRVEPDPEGRPGVLGIHFEARGPRLAGVPQSVDSAIGFMHRTMLAVHGPYGLASVHLPHPCLAPRTRYTAFFGAPVRFDAPHAVLCVPDSLAAEPLRRSDPLVARLAVEHLAARLPEGTDVADGVRFLLRRYLASGDVGIARVAGRLGLPPRTLQRRLADEGVAYERLLDEVRRETALQLLTTTDLPTAEVAARVGLSGTSSLTRASRRWFGATPTAVRAGGVAVSSS